MITTTMKQYDIRHTGDEMDRLDILAAFGELKRRTKLALMCLARKAT